MTFGENDKHILQPSLGIKSPTGFESTLRVDRTMSTKKTETDENSFVTKIPRCHS